MNLGVALIIKDDLGKIIMQLRDDKSDIPFSNCWSVFTGGIEKRDFSGSLMTTLESGVRREIGEELKVSLNGEKSIYVPRKVGLIHSGFYKDDKQNVEQYVFAAKLEYPFESLRLMEGKALGRFTLEQIKSMQVAANYKDIIFKYYAHI